MAMQLVPLHDIVVIKPTPPEEMSDGGIYLPAIAQEKTTEGIVVSIGPGKYVGGHFVPTSLQPGDHVVYSKYGGTEIKVGRHEYVTLPETDVRVKLIVGEEDGP